VPLCPTQDDPPLPDDPRVRLSDYPQGRIKVFKDDVGWGSVCGHYLWDSNAGAVMTSSAPPYSLHTAY
jgi:hypothetical protein